MADTPSPYTVGQTLWTVSDRTEAHVSIDQWGEWRSAGRSAIAWLEAWTVERVTPRGAWVISGNMRRWVPLDPKRHGRTPVEARDKAAGLRAYHVARCEQRTTDARERLAAIRALDVDKKEVTRG